ncbi:MULTISPECIES: methylated-DNA--[protein]-cysteine S-methyltransferase [Nocardia]|uniref:methylated-DNA--[protein]-cysteine S-methyltransferase n=2 Tax=Nocardia TaxID=1817 RepID=UPI000D6999E9|nr:MULTISPECIES: methylated-DNA--[protein]-cysteine S-methyltransferase [Nocardia]
MTMYATVDSPLGELLLVGAPSTRGPALTSLTMAGQRGETRPRADWVEDRPAFADIAAQLHAYFTGAATAFDIERGAGGSEFQRRVWSVLDTIPYGTTVTYGEVTTRAGMPRERVRAVASAIGANPVSIIRPCHRVIGANGSLTGYAGGLARKQRLLEMEGVLLAT